MNHSSPWRSQSSIMSVSNSATTESTKWIKTLSKLMNRFDLYNFEQQDPEESMKEYDLLEEYSRILTSQKEPSIVPDENSIVNNIHDTLKQSPHNVDKAYQFVHLYNKLSSTQRLKKKWSVLYLFSLLNNLPIQQPGASNNSVSSRSSMSASSFGLYNIDQLTRSQESLHLNSSRSFEEQSRRPYETSLESPQSQRRRLTPNDPPAVQLAKARSDQANESEILRDLVFVLQGIDGQYIRFDPMTEEYLIDDRLTLTEPTQQLVYRLTETGWLYTHVKKSIEDGLVGLVGQSLCAAIQNELTSYYQLIAIVEAQVEKQMDQKVWNDQSLTLKRLLVWMEEANNKLRLLTMLVDASQGQKGGALVSALHNHTKHGDPFIRQFITNILQHVFTPFYTMIQRWVYEGELDDPYQEFFVVCDMTVPEQELWQNKYSIREDMLPSFISRDLALKIFSIGKSLNFIRYSCHDGMDPYQLPLREKLDYGETRAVERAINAIYKDTGRSLVSLLKTKYRLMDHLRALKRYLLLGQGDYIEYLMDVLGPQLDKPASTLFRHHLTGILETAIRSSNAQYDDPEILSRLNVRLLEAQKNDSGWDVFSLDYHVDTPINTVINPNAMIQYLQIFNFLWRLKRVGYTLSASWKQCGKSNRQFLKLPDLAKDLREVQMTIQKMVHFIYQLQHYVLFEVLECSWEKLENDIENHSIDLDSIIKSHTHYLKAIIEKGFLSGRKKNVLAYQLNYLFDCILKYKIVLDHLCIYADKETASKHNKYALDGGNRERLDKIRRQHQEIQSAFTTHVLQFLDALRSYHDEDLRSLSTRLDYNNFYSK